MVTALVAARVGRHHGEHDPLDVTSKPAKPQLAFGAGRHHRLGATLGKMEVQEMIAGLTTRWPAAAVADGACVRCRVADAPAEWTRPNEIMQLVVHPELVPDIPDEAICIHTRQVQELGPTRYDWYTTGAQIEPEVDGRDHSWENQLAELYLQLDPPEPS